MPIAVSIPNRSTKTGEQPSSRKLLAIAVAEPRSKANRRSISHYRAATRQHYLKELEAQGLLNER